LVCLAQDGSGGVTKCSSTDNSIVGVISGTYGFIGNSAKENDPNQVVVGLVGQLPVFVSTSNGEIKAGDALTFSGDPGVAVKATTAGYILGHAVEDTAHRAQARLKSISRPVGIIPMLILPTQGLI